MSEAKGEGLRRAIERAAARRAEAGAAGESHVLEIVSFSIADEWYGFRLPDLVEIIGGVEPTPIPFTPPFIPGVINHRGSIVAVIDLRKVFGLPGRYRKAKGRVLLVGSGGTVVGFQADTISDVVRVPATAVDPPLSTIEKVKSEYMEGCVRLPRGLLVLLSASALVDGLRSTATDA